MANSRINTKNVKQQPIPVVPTNMRIVNQDGTVTRSGKLLLEQLQAVSGTFVTEVPSGTMDGTNTIFTLTGTPAWGILFLNGVEQVPGVDYTISDSTITFTVPPKADDLMVAAYTE